MRVAPKVAKRKDVVHYGAIHEAAELAPFRIAFTRIPHESEVLGQE